MVELGQGGPRHWRVRCPPDVRSPLALVNPVCSVVVVVVGVVIGERGSEERESQLSRWLPLQGTCVKIAIHQQPIPSHPSRPEEEGVTCRSDGLRGVPTMGHSFAKCCGSHSREIALGNLPFPAFLKHKCGIFSSRSMRARCYAGKRSEPVLGQTRNEILEDKMFARSEIRSPLLFCTFSRSNSTFSRASPAFVALSSPPPSPSLHPFDAAATAATNLMSASVAPSIIR